LLATFASPDFVTATQSFLVALSAMDRLKHSGSGPEIASQIDTSSGNPTNSNFQERLQKLENMGMSGVQIEEIRRTRKIPESIKILAPADGFVLSRNVSEGQKFDRGTELYRIANLKRVWILADVSASDAQHLRPGMRADISLADGSMALPARVSDILPQFDPSSARLKLRLEAENSGYMLRPDMFVDARVSITFPSTITLPADAVLDSGLSKRVFVARGAGVFEPREVEIGTRFDDRVQIVSGLAPGERVVIAGNFLLDSESKLKRESQEKLIPAGHEPHSAAPAVKQAATDSPRVNDPACGMQIEKHKAVAAGRTSTYHGTTYYFCSDSCKHKFEGDAAGLLKRTAF
jgi:Cu(I)/Ag(I) efflux system membrane fusion protein